MSKIGIKWVGWVLSVLGCAFVIWRLVQPGESEGGIDWLRREVLALVVGGGIAYALALCFLAVGWKYILDAMGGGVSHLKVLRYFPVLQIYKYIPGNVFHYVGRHHWLKSVGLGPRASIGSAVGEGALLGVSGIIVSLIFAREFINSWLSGAEVGFILLGVLLVGAVCAGLALRFRFVRIADFSRLRHVCVLKAVVAYFAFFLVFGICFALLLSIFWGSSISIQRFVAIWAASWVIGFFTPGAPSGIGLREAFMVSCFEISGLDDNAAFIAIISRLSTVVGDVFFALMGFSLRGAISAPLRGPN